MARINGKLSNEKFVANANPEVVPPSASVWKS
jgi:valyl-tRNA synthetase